MIPLRSSPFGSAPNCAPFRNIKPPAPALANAPRNIRRVHFLIRVLPRTITSGGLSAALTKRHAFPQYARAIFYLAEKHELPGPDMAHGFRPGRLSARAACCAERMSSRIASAACVTNFRRAVTFTKAPARPGNLFFLVVTALFYIPVRRCAEQSFVIAIELGDTFITHGSRGIGCPFLFRQHEPLCFAQSKLLDVLHGTQSCEALEIPVQRRR